MNAELLDLLRELERSGRDNDAATEDRSQKMLNITHDTGVFLALLIKAARCRNVLEIGTSNPAHRDAQMRRRSRRGDVRRRSASPGTSGAAHRGCRAVIAAWHACIG
jgi:hypothetical protein